MPTSKTLKPVFGQKHRDYINSAVSHTVSVAEGAVRAGKTIDNITAFAYMIDQGVPDRIHLVTGATVATAKLNIGDSNGMGLESIFRGRCKWGKYKGNEALFIFSKDRRRQYIVIFAGGGKADSYKRIRGNSYGMWLATEINLHHKDMIKEAFNRQLAAKVRRVFWDLNPINPGAWIYREYINNLADMFPGQYNYQHFTLFDNATLTPERIEEIKLQYVPGSIWYKRDIDGERCAAEGLVYPMYIEAMEETYEAFREDENGNVTRNFSDYVISIDYGTMNPFAALKWVKGKDGVWHCIEEYYYSGRETNRQKTDADYVLDMIAFTADHGEGDIRVIVDPSATSFKTALRRNDQRSFKVMDADNDVLAGIQDTATCLQETQSLVKISNKCTRTIGEFGGYVWDEKEDSDRPIKENDHAMDALRYFVKTMRIYRPEKPYQSIF